MNIRHFVNSFLTNNKKHTESNSRANDEKITALTARNPSSRRLNAVSYTLVPIVTPIMHKNEMFTGAVARSITPSQRSSGPLTKKNSERKPPRTTKSLSQSKVYLPSNSR